MEAEQVDSSADPGQLRRALLFSHLGDDLPTYLGAAVSDQLRHRQYLSKQTLHVQRESLLGVFGHSFRQRHALSAVRIALLVDAPVRPVYGADVRFDKRFQLVLALLLQRKQHC